MLELLENDKASANEAFSFWCRPKALGQAAESTTCLL